MDVGKTLNTIGIILTVLFIVPTAMIVVTWDTLPGQKLYPVKRSLERIALSIVGGNFEVKTGFQAKLVERRFEESTKMLAQASTVDVSNFTQEVKEVKNNIIVQAEKTDVVQSEVAIKKADELIVQLKKYDTELEKKKTEPVETVNTNVTSAPTPVPTILPKIEEKKEEVKQNVTEMQDEIRKTIKELEDVKKEKNKNKHENRGSRQRD